MRWSIRTSLSTLAPGAVVAVFVMSRRPPPAEKVTLSARDVPIRELCRMMSDVSGTDIEVDDRVRGAVSVWVTDVPWRDVLKAAVEAVGGCALEARGRGFRGVPARTAPLVMTLATGSGAPPDPCPLTIDLRDATVAAGIEEFRRLAPEIRLDLDNGWPEDYRVGRFEARGASWRSALREFARRTEGQIDEVSPTALRFSRPPRVFIGPRELPMAPTIDLIARMTGLNIVMSSDVTGTLPRGGPGQDGQELLNSGVPAAGPYVVVSRDGIVRIARGSAGDDLGLTR